MPSLFDNSYFDPATYGGVGGLFGNLLSSAAYQNPAPQGFSQLPNGTPDYGQTNTVQIGSGPSAYQLPIFGSSAGDPAALPQNAQPTSGQMPPSSPDFGDRLLSGLKGFAGGMRGNGGLFGAIGDAAGAFSTGVVPENTTAKALMARGLDQTTAGLVARDPQLLRAVLPSLMGTSGKTDNIKEYEYAKLEDPSLTFDKFMARKKSVNGEFGLTPIWGTGPDGKPAYIQPGKSGEAKLAALPKGFEIARDPIKVDAGTSWILLDPQTRQPVGNVPKDIAGAKIAEAKGESQGKAQVELPGNISDAEQTKTKIDQLLNHEGLSSIFGPIDQFRPSWTMGDQGRDALARYNQLKGSAFLQAYALLRGGGAITEVEGKKAEDAMARLDRAQDEETAKLALKDFRDAIDVGVNKLRARAGVTGANPAVGTAPQPAPGGGGDLKKKYGLD